MLTIITVILVAYLIGAIPFALIVARACGIPDIRKVGSGNVGATNVQRMLGWKASLWVFAADVGKGMAAVLLARQAHQTLIAADVLLALAALAAILGHIFPVYLRFHGGKGVLTALGSFCVLMPVPALISFAVFLLVTIAFRYISLGSICGATTCPLVLAVQQYAFHDPVSAVRWGLAILIAILVPITHRSNIRRLMQGSENRFSLRATSHKVAPHA
jgi:acyl phosphate:glycerol-3-phosphate acyltransferase